MKIKNLLAVIFVFCIGIAHASDWPNKSIRFISPYPPGGSNDNATRLIAEKLSPMLKQPIFVENVPGKDAVLASHLITQAKPDGYNFVMLASSHTANPLFYDKLPYDTNKDFSHIIQVVKVPLFLIVPADSPIKSASELIAAASQPNGINISTTGNGSGPHLALLVLKNITNANLNHAPYIGDKPALADIKAGKVHGGIHPYISALPDIKDGKVRVLAVFGSKRSSVLPDVPSLGELGYPNTDVYAWFGLAGPAKLPAKIVNRMNKDVNAILLEPTVKQRLADMGMEPLGGTPAQYEKFILDGMRQWKEFHAQHPIEQVKK
jgi:tripartite-type tricarboxylate transporter receptor subunit TctC